ncbi:MAG: ASKHA domain-containing protein, partial [Candidatus Ornithomonoglobus sp.]
DVLSRIDAASRGRGAELQSTVEYQLNKCLKAVGGKGMRTVIAANTTMVSLLMGYDCSGLGRYPFTAENLESIHCGNTSIAGGISAFVGGDITSGLYMCGFDENEEINLFVDLGTNGEMAIGNCRRILCTSTAAGPAFEGGRISCGTGSVEGAICAVSIKDKHIETIGGKEPCGICGTGIVELAAELAENGYIDKTGLYNEEYAAGYEVAKGIVFTQKDVRELQTAKAAVRAGIEILLEEYGAEEDKIQNVYIAGGFGKRLNIEKACRIGLLPKRFIGRYKAVGNSSLGGCVKLLENNDGFECIDRIRSVSEDFPLAERKGFTESFMRYMEF